MRRPIVRHDPDIEWICLSGRRRPGECLSRLRPRIAGLERQAWRRQETEESPNGEPAPHLPPMFQALSTSPRKAIPQATHQGAPNTGRPSNAGNGAGMTRDTSAPGASTSSPARRAPSPRRV